MRISRWKPTVHYRCERRSCKILFPVKRAFAADNQCLQLQIISVCSYRCALCSVNSTSAVKQTDKEHWCCEDKISLDTIRCGWLGSKHQLTNDAKIRQFWSKSWAIDWVKSCELKLVWIFQQGVPSWTRISACLGYRNPSNFSLESLQASLSLSLSFLSLSLTQKFKDEIWSGTCWQTSNSLNPCDGLHPRLHGSHATVLPFRD